MLTYVNPILFKIGSFQSLKCPQHFLCKLFNAGPECKFQSDNANVASIIRIRLCTRQKFLFQTYFIQQAGASKDGRQIGCLQKCNQAFNQEMIQFGIV